MPAPNVIICENCHERREAHARNLCKTCYDKIHPGNRPWGFCAAGERCPRAMQYQQLWSRGLCASCYDRERKAGNLALYPKIQKRPDAPVQSAPGLPSTTLGQS